MKRVEGRHFSIAVPTTWKVESTGSGDLAGLWDPANPTFSITVLTYVGQKASKASLLARWQFKDRQPMHVIGPAGLEGVIAAGANQPERHLRVRSVSYCFDQRWEQVVSVIGSAETLDDQATLVETILRSYIPRVDAGR